MKARQLIDLAAEHYAERDVTRIKHAVQFATKAHEGQTRASGDPYIQHCFKVAETLIDWRLDSNSVIAGLLHDSVEDSGVSLLTLEEEFGKDVAFLVDGVTKVGVARAGMADISTYLPQTRDNLSKLLVAVSHDLRVLLIKLADRLHNLQTLQYLSPTKQRKIARESLEVFAPLADRLGIGRLRLQIEELAYAYVDPSEYARLKKLIKKRLGKSHRKLAKTRQEVEKTLTDIGIPHTMDGRIKSVYSLHKKLRKVNGDIERVYDLIALRIIVENKNQCYQVLGILHGLYQPMLTKIKDYIAAPKPNGYQSLHTTVLTPEEQIVEFQIRTQTMHERAERGLAASFYYNEQKVTNNYIDRTASELPRNLQWITKLQMLTDRLQSGERLKGGELAVDLFADRIFVYSPKGDIFDLPEGSYPLDFAFAVHSDIAVHAFAVRINGKIAPFNRKLQNGDIIQVETKRTSNPKSDWLNWAKTARARQKIRQFLAKHQ